MTGVALALRQGSTEWLDARRALITGTDLPILLGISPYRCEADLADEKLGGPSQESTLRMRIGSALEDLIAAEYTAVTGRRVRRYRAMVRHPEYAWAAASPDAAVIGERRLVEMKRTGSRTRFADGIPQDVEAQVAWQLGCTGYPVADIAVLTDDSLTVYEQAADPALFANLVAVAVDFRRRLLAGGPFARDAARIRRDHPTDDGTEMDADGDLIEAVRALIDVQSALKLHGETEKALKRAITDRMGDAAVLRGPDWHCTWKTSKAPVVTDWESIATGLLTTLPETERAAFVGLHQTTGKAQRPLRVWMDKED
jgi:putative phage-type endonuclease